MKIHKKECVVYDWVFELPFTQQAVLMCAIRGADGVSRWDASKRITQFIRGIVLKPAYNGFSLDDDFNPDGFMRCDYQAFERDTRIFFADVDTLPHHFLMHLIHAIEIIGYQYPDDKVRKYYRDFYFKACRSLHVTPETEEQMNLRLAK